MGLDVPEEHFYTSALATAAFLKDQAPGCSVFAIGEAGLLNALYDAGITMNDVNPDYVVVGEGRTYSLDTLTKATNLVHGRRQAHRRQLRRVRPHRKRHCPGLPGALVAPIEMATGKQAYFCGKPNPLMMRTGLRLLHCHSAEAVMVGDRMDTDVISGHGERHVHSAGALRRVHPARRWKPTPTAQRHGAGRRGRHRPSGP